MGVVKFDNPGTVIKIGNFQERFPISWLKNKACADGVVITSDDNGSILHIVEIKTKLNMKKWKHSKVQFEGAALNAKCVLNLLEIMPFYKIICYISYVTEDLSPKKSANSIYLKKLVGKNSPMVDNGSWMNETLSLCGVVDIPVVKILRDPDTGIGHGVLSTV